MYLLIDVSSLEMKDILAGNEPSAKSGLGWPPTLAGAVERYAEAVES